MGNEINREELENLTPKEQDELRRNTSLKFLMDAHMSIARAMINTAKDVSAMLTIAKALRNDINANIATLEKLVHEAMHHQGPRQIFTTTDTLNEPGESVDEEPTMSTSKILD